MLRTFFEQEKIEYYTPLSPDDITLWDREKYARTEAQIGKIRGVVVFLIPYNAGQKTTNLSVYAQVKDYHLYLRELSDRLEFFFEEKKISLSEYKAALKVDFEGEYASLRAYIINKITFMNIT